MKFKVGDRVKDEDFGEGTVVETNTGSGKISILVKFDKEDCRLHNGNSCCLKGPYEEKHCWFYTGHNQEQLKLIKNYTYEDLKKSPIGTKITFEDGAVLVKDGENSFENISRSRNIAHLCNLKDNYSSLGKIIKIEEPEYKTVYKSKVEILDEAEKRYLRNFITPFKNSIETIRRLYSPTKKKDYIQIRYRDDRPTNFPYFESNTMYKGMELNKNYTLEELGL